MGDRNATITVTTPSGERVSLELEPGHTAQDVVSALIQGGKLPAEDSSGNAIRYELIDDASMTMLSGNSPLLEQGVGDGAELRVKPGARGAQA